MKATHLLFQLGSVCIVTPSNFSWPREDGLYTEYTAERNSLEGSPICRGARANLL